MKTFREFLKEQSFRDFEIDKHVNIIEQNFVGFNVARANMPQLKVDEFLKFLQKLDIVYNLYTGNVFKFNPTQKDFDQDKVNQIVSTNSDLTKLTPILVSEDGFILDGHHRYFASIQTGLPIQYIVIDLPINKLLKLAIQYVEEIDV